MRSGVYCVVQMTLPRCLSPIDVDCTMTAVWFLDNNVFSRLLTRFIRLSIYMRCNSVAVTISCDINTERNPII